MPTLITIQLQSTQTSPMWKIFPGFIFILSILSALLHSQVASRSHFLEQVVICIEEGFLLTATSSVRDIRPGH